MHCAALFRPVSTGVISRFAGFGQRAIDWMNAQGYAEVPENAELMVSADTCVFGHSVLRRMSHTATSCEIAESKLLPRAECTHTTFLFIISGQARVTTQHQVYVLAAGDFIITPRRDLRDVCATADLSYAEIVGWSSQLAKIKGHLITGHAMEPARSMLFNAVAAILQNTLTMIDQVGAIEASLSELARAVTTTAHHINLGDNYSYAIRAMNRSFSDPSFSIDRLAAKLSVSRSQLYRDFEANHQSLAAVLRELRVARARQLLDSAANAGQRPNFTSIARQSGFGSPRTMLRALSDEGK